MLFTMLVFAFFFFLGFLAMFIYSERRRENLVRSLSDEHAQLRVLMRALESRLDHLESSGKGSQNPEFSSITNSSGASGIENPEHDPLLRLSFEEPGKSDPALELMEETDRKNVSQQQ